jgi:hypothetical protein
VDTLNEGGPFGTPMHKLASLLSSMKEHPEILEVDRKKMEKVLQEFNEEISKVSTPIYEKVEKREVKASDGNPSDLNYKKEEKPKTVKMKVVNNRQPLKTIPEEKPPLADDFYLGSNTLDYLDDIFGEEPQEEAKEECKVEEAPAPPSQKLVENFLNKPVVKKKVKFSAEVEEQP